MSRKPIIGVMGGGKVSKEASDRAFELGAMIARQGWILLNGGRNCGIMDASARGARSQGGLTLGILPDADDSRASDHIDIAILTGMGNARNVINVMTSDVVVAFEGGAGTLSEIALALKLGKPLILLGRKAGSLFEPHRGQLKEASSAQEVVSRIREYLKI